MLGREEEGEGKYIECIIGRSCCFFCSLAGIEESRRQEGLLSGSEGNHLCRQDLWP